MLGMVSENDLKTLSLIKIYQMSRNNKEKTLEHRYMARHINSSRFFPRHPLEHCWATLHGDLQDGVNLQHNGIYRDDPDAFLELQKVRGAVT